MCPVCNVPLEADGRCNSVKGFGALYYVAYLTPDGRMVGRLSHGHVPEVPAGFVGRLYPCVIPNTETFDIEKWKRKVISHVSRTKIQCKRPDTCITEPR